MLSIAIFLGDSRDIGIGGSRDFSVGGIGSVSLRDIETQEDTLLVTWACKGTMFIDYRYLYL